MTEQLHQISIPGLPAGWRIKEIKLIDCGRALEITPGSYEYNQFLNMAMFRCEVIVEKIQPRRIVLEETEAGNGKHEISWSFANQVFLGGKLILENQPKIWREVKE